MSILSLLLAALLAVGSASAPIGTADSNEAGTNTTNTQPAEAENPPPPDDDVRSSIIDIG